MTRAPEFVARLAQAPAEVAAAQRLRYEVFVAEGGSRVAPPLAGARREADRFDAFCDHLLLFDLSRPPDEQVVGAYRLMTQPQAESAGQFYSASEYALAPLLTSGKRLLELGRSCLHCDYRGGAALLHLWRGLAQYVAQRRIEVMFGVASFHGTDVAALAQPLSYLHHYHLAPEPLRVTAQGPTAVSMNVVAPAQLDRAAAVRQIPALLKAYLRLGAHVGDGAFVDHAFNTVDVCVVLEEQAVSRMQRQIYMQSR